MRNTEQWFWFAIWFTLPINIKLNGLAILLAFVVFAIRAINNPPSFKKEYLLYVVPLILYFLVQLIPMGNRIFQMAGWKETEQQLPLLALPLLFMLGHIDKRSFTKTASSGLFFAVLFASIIMISESVFRFLNGFDYTVFIYHRLAEPFDSGAIYFSFFIVLVLLRIEEMPWLFYRKWVGVFAASMLIIVLFLLASKLILLIGMMLILIKQAKFFRSLFKWPRFAIPLLFVVVLIMLIPIGQRFSEILNPRLDIVNNESYSYDSPLNGLNLRLIQSRLGFEILDQNDAWLFGVGMDQSQELLNSKYIEKGIYTGYQGTEDRGYINYNFHNQYMETWVRSGFLGLLTLSIILIVLIKSSSQNKFASPWEIVLILAFFITESVLERQIGIVYFCLAYSSYFPTKMIDLK
jgi:O-antigen ligase